LAVSYILLLVILILASTPCPLPRPLCPSTFFLCCSQPVCPSLPGHYRSPVITPGSRVFIPLISADGVLSGCDRRTFLSLSFFIFLLCLCHSVVNPPLAHVGIADRSVLHTPSKWLTCSSVIFGLHFDDRYIHSIFSGWYSLIRSLLFSHCSPFRFPDWQNRKTYVWWMCSFWSAGCQSVVSPSFPDLYLRAIPPYSLL